jgi:hypothetical protein
MYPVGGPDNNLMGALTSRTAPYNSCTGPSTTFAQWPTTSNPPCPVAMVSGWTSGTVTAMKIASAPLPTGIIVANTLWGTNSVTTGMSDCIPCLQ